jgi:hypothetical protein
MKQHILFHASQMIALSLGNNVFLREKITTSLFRKSQSELGQRLIEQTWAADQLTTTTGYCWSYLACKIGQPGHIEQVDGTANKAATLEAGAVLQPD